MIGHRGAAALAPENTLAALEAAVEAGADLVEFDVDDGLLLGHPGVATTEQLRLDDALAYLATTAIGIHLDLKPVGVEAEIGAAVERHGLTSRVIVSSTSVRALRALAGAAPGLGTRHRLPAGPPRCLLDLLAGAARPRRCDGDPSVCEGARRAAALGNSRGGARSASCARHPAP